MSFESDPRHGNQENDFTFTINASLESGILQCTTKENGSKLNNLRVLGLSIPMRTIQGITSQQFL